MKEMVYMNKSILDLLDSGIYNGYQYRIVSRGLHPCAYVELPEGHKYYGLDYNDIPVDCHGSLTYSYIYVDGLFSGTGWWIGWDYAHSGDYTGLNLCEHWKKWTTAEILEEVKQVIDQLLTMKTCDPSECDDCIYIGEGDFYCQNEQEIVISDFVPTDEYLCCLGEKNND